MNTPQETRMPFLLIHAIMYEKVTRGRFSRCRNDTREPSPCCIRRLYMNIRKSANRIWEIDFFRGLAIILMIFDHLFFDLITIYNVHIPLVSDSLAGFYNILQYFFAGCFILMSGISSSFSRSNLKRGLRLLLIALLLTLATYVLSLFQLVDKSFIIFFGILHLLAVCMLLGSVLIKLNKYVLVIIGGVIIACIPLVDKLNELILLDAYNNVYNFFNNIPNYFAIFGIYNSNFFSGDYFPLVPWLGIFMIGLGFGKIFYTEKISLIKYDLKPNLFNYAGRYSIWVYLIHQPVLIGILWLIFGH